MSTGTDNKIKMTQAREKNYKSLDENGWEDGQRRALTIEEMLEHVGFGLPQIKIIMMSGFVLVADGMETMVLTILGSTLEYEWQITPVQQAVLTTLVFVGGAIGAPAFGYIADNYGRRTSLILSALWTLFYGVLCAGAPNFTWMLILRMLLGLGLGGGMHVNTYCAEILPGKYRGKFLIFLLVFWALGGLFAIAAAILLMQFGWRYWLLSAALPNLIFLAFSPFIPESPRFELACGRKSEALRILSDLAAGNGRVLPDAVLKEIEIKQKGNIADLFSQRFRKTSLLLSIILFSIGFLYFGIALFTTPLIRAGNTCGTAFTMTTEYTCPLQIEPLTTSNYVDLLWTTSAEIPGLIVTLFIVDTLGRKLGTLLECVVVGIACLLLNICMPGIPMVILLFLGRGLSNSAYQIMLLYTNEVYPTEIRTLANGLSITYSILGAALTPFVANVLFGWSLHGGLVVYTVIAFISAVATCFLPTETKGKEMSDDFQMTSGTKEVLSIQ